MRSSIVLNRPSWEFARPIIPTKNQAINLGSVIGRIEQEQGRRMTPSQKQEMEAWFEASFGGLGSHRCGRDLTRVPDGHRGLQNQGYGPGWNLGACRRISVSFARMVSPEFGWREVPSGATSILKWVGSHVNGIGRNLTFAVLATHAEVVITDEGHNWEVSKPVAWRFPVGISVEESCCFNLPEVVGFSIGLSSDQAIPLPADMKSPEELVSYYRQVLSGERQFRGPHETGGTS